MRSQDNFHPIQTRVAEAAAGPAPRARLARLMAELLEQGLERGEIFAALEGARDQLMREGRPELAEYVSEALDGFTGWCRLD